MIRSLKKESKKAVSLTLVKYSKKTTPTPTMALCPSPTPTMTLRPTSCEWTQIGTDFDGEAVEDRSGYSMSLSSDGTTVAIGAFYNNGNSGHIRLYKLGSSSQWTLVGKKIDGEAVCNYSGTSESLFSDGKTVAIGAYYNDGVKGSISCHARVFEWSYSN
jgi:hypothetical protein